MFFCQVGVCFTGTAAANPYNQGDGGTFSQPPSRRSHGTCAQEVFTVLAEQSAFIRENACNLMIV
jgi:hypothetical protein